MKHTKHKYPDHKKNDPLEKKAGKLFEGMGYEVEYNRCFSGCKVDIFAKKKKIIGSNYQSWVCLVDNGNGRVPKDAVDSLYHTWKIVKKELAKESSLYADCQAMFISAKGFTKEARAAGREYRIELKTLDLLRKDKEEFIKDMEKQIRDFDDLLRNSADINQWVPDRFADHCLAHLILLRILRMLVKNHKEWESLEYDYAERKAVEIIKLVGYDD